MNTLDIISLCFVSMAFLVILGTGFVNTVQEQPPVDRWHATKSGQIFYVCITLTFILALVSHFFKG